jgi:hypothetical protein
LINQVNKHNEKLKINHETIFKKINNELVYLKEDNKNNYNLIEKLYEEIDKYKISIKN